MCVCVSVGTQHFLDDRSLDDERRIDIFFVLCRGGPLSSFDFHGYPRYQTQKLLFRSFWYGKRASSRADVSHFVKAARTTEREENLPSSPSPTPIWCVPPPPSYFISPSTQQCVRLLLFLLPDSRQPIIDQVVFLFFSLFLLFSAYWIPSFLCLLCCCSKRAFSTPETKGEEHHVSSLIKLHTQEVQRLGLIIHQSG